MNIYKKMYFLLFHAITDALGALPDVHPASVILRRAQQQAEELYIEAGEDV